MGWIEKLQSRWNLGSARQVVLVLLVFALTGTTVAVVKEPVSGFIGLGQMNKLLSTIIYLIVVLPLYQVLLLVYAFVFGQFRFFWEFEKRMFQRMGRLFRKTKKEA